jgi:hypothetical protein
MESADALERSMPESPMSGAQFAREVGTDPERWAAQFLAAYALADGCRTDADRLAFTTQWFRDFADIVLKHAE